MVLFVGIFAVSFSYYSLNVINQPGTPGNNGDPFTSIWDGRTGPGFDQGIIVAETSGLSTVGPGIQEACPSNTNFDCGAGMAGIQAQQNAPLGNIQVGLKRVGTPTGHLKAYVYNDGSGAVVNPVATS